MYFYFDIWSFKFCFSFNNRRGRCFVVCVKFSRNHFKFIFSLFLTFFFVFANVMNQRQQHSTSVSIKIIIAVQAHWLVLLSMLLLKITVVSFNCKYFDLTSKIFWHICLNDVFAIKYPYNWVNNKFGKNDSVGTFRRLKGITFCFVQRSTCVTNSEK